MSAKFTSRTFIPTRQAGLDRLAGFVPAAGRSYTNRRNTDYGPDDRGNVSVLSPYIRQRLITEREVLDAVLDRHALEAAEKFVHEVFWRSYFKGHLETRPALWSRYRAALVQQQANVNAGGSFARAYRRAIEGKTGIDCFDAWVEELVETGYLHNHARMWFASIWIFTLKLPWELGADFTYRHFVDGDAASNTLSWRWVGGLHTRGKTYLARVDNIIEHSNGRFQPKGLAREAMPLDEPMPVPLTPLRLAQNEAAEGAALLLMTEEDLHPESLPLKKADIRGILGCHAARDRSDFEVSGPVLAFSDGALADGLARASQIFGVAGESVERLTGEVLVQKCRALGVTRVLAAYLSVGPMAEQVFAARPVLEQAGITLVEIRRAEDSLIWPHASKGFFGLRERIPNLLAQCGIKGGMSMEPDLFASDNRGAAKR